MQYIDHENKTLIIRKPINYSTTKTETKDGTNEHLKYICVIPNEVLILLLARFQRCNLEDQQEDFIDNILGQDKYYLCFSADGNNLFIDNSKLDKNSGASVTIQKNPKLHYYFFTVPKKVFNFLSNDKSDKHYFTYRVDFNNESDCFKNFVIGISVV